jgi:hypothetical protein
MLIDLLCRSMGGKILSKFSHQKIKKAIKLVQLIKMHIFIKNGYSSTLSTLSIKMILEE